MLKIETVFGKSAKKLKIKKNYAIIAFDDEPAEDILDYIYFDSLNNFKITLADESGKIFNVRVNKKPDETLGLSFYSDNLNIKMCKNNCLFCFVNQMPKNMRESLYIKDDDWRMSFLYGNYVTLTNLTETEKNKIIKRHISPLYISVQSMNPEIRKRLLGIKKNYDIKPLLKEFYDSGIKMNCQIVVCPGINDGKDLQNSLNELFMFRPCVESVALVPVGLTKFRENLPLIKPVDNNSAAEIVNLAREFNKHVGMNFVCPSDEFYLKAGLPFPSVEDYEDFPQLENGVGMIKLFETQFEEEFNCFSGSANRRKVLVATGVSSYEFIENLCEKLRKRFGIDIICKKIINNFFGESVTVTGLLTAQDIIAQTENIQCDEILISENCLKDNTVFLDDITLTEFEKIKKCKVTVCECNGAAFMKKVLGVK